MDSETVEAADNQKAYGKLINIAMEQLGISQRQLGKLSGLSRQRISLIIRNGDASYKERHSIFTALKIDPLRAHLAIERLNDPAAYFGAVAETVANFTQQFTTQLEKVSEIRGTEFEPIRRNLLTALVSEVTDRVIKHQELCDQRAGEFLG